MTAVIYCSGPLFCPEEMGSMAAIARTVEAAGFSTFLPQRDGLEARVLRFVDSPLNVRLIGERIDAAIFAVDVYQIVERCAALILNLNGRVPDEGGVAEAAIAFAVGKPVVLYKNDRRSPFSGRDNSMVTALSPLPPVTQVRRIPEALGELVGKAGGQPGAAQCERLRAAVTLGRRIWAILPSGAPGTGGANQALVDEIADLCAGTRSKP